MTPLLFSNATLQSGSYVMTQLGPLRHCLSCEVTEVRNGAYSLSLETTVNEELAESISSQKIIKAKPNPSDDWQNFIITKTERTIDGHIKVEAEHFKSLVDSICSEGDSNYDGTVVTKTGTPLEIWNMLMADYITTTNPFSFTSNISSSEDFTLGFSVAESLGNILGGKEGSMIDTYGGEFHWNNTSIEFLSSRGSDTGYLVKYGKNISDATQSESAEGCYSHILPYGKVLAGEKKINFYAPLVEISGTECAYNKTFMLDCTDMLENYNVGATLSTKATVQTRMREYARKYAAANNLGSVGVSIAVDLRAELDEMASIGLCDTVQVILDNFGTMAKAKITEATYDVLLERWNRLVIGSSKITVADLILNKRRFLGGK